MTVVSDGVMGPSHLVQHIYRPRISVILEAMCVEGYGSEVSETESMYLLGVTKKNNINPEKG